VKPPKPEKPEHGVDCWRVHAGCALRAAAALEKARRDHHGGRAIRLETAELGVRRRGLAGIAEHGSEVAEARRLLAAEPNRWKSPR
jgi:hypothetical protein